MRFARVQPVARPQSDARADARAHADPPAASLNGVRLRNDPIPAPSNGHASAPSAQMLSSPSASQRMQRASDRFQIHRVLWNHPLGKTFAATDRQNGQRTMITVLYPITDITDEQLERCQTDNDLLFEFAVPRVHTTTELFRRPDGRIALVYPHANARSLCEQLYEQPLPIGRTVAILRQVCKSLTAAHDAGVRHGALTPASILLSGRHGRPDAVCVTDFGLVHLIANGIDLPAASISSHPMSPERAAGRPATLQEDVYLVGCLGYAMLTGAPPFAVDDESGFRQLHATSDPVPIEVRLAGQKPPHPAITRVLYRCLAKIPEQRYSDLADFETELCLAQIQAGVQTYWDDLPPARVRDARHELITKSLRRSFDGRSSGSSSSLRFVPSDEESYSGAPRHLIESPAGPITLEHIISPGKPPARLGNTGPTIHPPRHSYPSVIPPNRRNRGDEPPRLPEAFPISLDADADRSRAIDIRGDAVTRIEGPFSQLRALQENLVPSGSSPFAVPQPLGDAQRPTSSPPPPPSREDWVRRVSKSPPPEMEMGDKSTLRGGMVSASGHPPRARRRQPSGDHPVLSHHGALTDERPTKTRPVQSNTGKRTVVDGVRSLAQLSNTQLKPIADALEPAHATDPISALKAEQRIRIVYAASGILGAGIAGALFAFVEANGARLEAEQNPSPRAQIVTAATPIPDEPEAVPPAPAPATTPPPPTTHLPVPENPEEGVVPADPARMDESAPAMATASAKKAPPSSSKRSSDNRETTARSKTSPPRSTVDAGALAQRGNAAFRRGKYRQAASLLGKAVRQAPGNASYRLSLGDALFRLGSYSAAQQHYDRAAKLGHPSASRRLAKVKSKLGG